MQHMVSFRGELIVGFWHFQIWVIAIFQAGQYIRRGGLAAFSSTQQIIDFAIFHIFKVVTISLIFSKFLPFCQD